MKYNTIDHLPLNSAASDSSLQRNKQDNVLGLLQSEAKKVCSFMLFCDLSLRLVDTSLADGTVLTVILAVNN